MGIFKKLGEIYLGFFKKIGFGSLYDYNKNFGIPEGDSMVKCWAAQFYLEKSITESVVEGLTGTAYIGKSCFLTITTSNKLILKVNELVGKKSCWIFENGEVDIVDTGKNPKTKIAGPNKVEKGKVINIIPKNDDSYLPIIVCESAVSELLNWK